jgi:peptidoglycan/LPS O-acetylase OafA/YrhL
MLLVLRLLALTVGIATGYRVLNGSMNNPVFKVPELAVGGALILAALLPKSAAPSALTAASAYALGVFSIVLSGYLVPGRPVDPLLMAAMAINLATILLLLPRGGHH